MVIGYRSSKRRKSTEGSYGASAYFNAAEEWLRCRALFGQPAFTWEAKRLRHKAASQSCLRKIDHGRYRTRRASISESFAARIGSTTSTRRRNVMQNGRCEKVNKIWEYREPPSAIGKHEVL